MEAFDGAVLAVVLTGMGSDGKLGAQAVRAAGGYVIAQDKATSVVWGMPGAVATAGHADEVLPLDAVADAVMKRVPRPGAAASSSAPAVGAFAAAARSGLAAGVAR